MATGWAQVLVLAAAVFMASIDGVRAAVAKEEMLGIWATKDKVPKQLVLDDPSGPLNFTLVDGMKKISCRLDPVQDGYWKDDGSWERIEKSDLPGATLKVLAIDQGAGLVVLYNFKELPVRSPPAPSTVEYDATLGGLMSPPLPSGQSFWDLRMAATPGGGVVVGWGVQVGDWLGGVIHDVHARECTSGRACTATQTLYQGPSGDSSSEKSTTYELLPPLKGDTTYGLIVAEQCDSCLFRELQLRASRDAQWVATLDDSWSMPGDRSVRSALNTKTGESYFVAYNDGLEEYKFVLATRNVPISVVTLPVGDHLGQRGELRVIYVERHDLFVVLVHLIRGSGLEEKPELLLLRFSAVTGKQIGDRVVLTDIVTELDSREAFDSSLQTETTLVLVSAVDGDGDAKELERYRTDLLVQKIDIGGEGEDSVIKPVQRHPFRGWGWEDSDFGHVEGMTLLPMTGTLVVEIVTVPLLTFSTIRLFKLSGDEAGLRSLPGTDITDVSVGTTGLGGSKYSAASLGPGKGFAILYASAATGGLYLKTYDDLPDSSPSVTPSVTPSVNSSSLTAVTESSGSLHATTVLTMLAVLVAGWCL